MSLGHKVSSKMDNRSLRSTNVHIHTHVYRFFFSLLYRFFFFLSLSLFSYLIIPKHWTLVRISNKKKRNAFMSKRTPAANYLCYSMFTDPIEISLKQNHIKQNELTALVYGCLSINWKMRVMFDKKKRKKSV
jgi:hypothetical protein